MERNKPIVDPLRIYSLETVCFLKKKIDKIIAAIVNLSAKYGIAGILPNTFLIKGNDIPQIAVTNNNVKSALSCFFMSYPLFCLSHNMK